MTNALRNSFTPISASSRDIADIFARSGNTKNPFAIDIMTALTINPDDKDLLELTSYLTLPGLIAREDDPFVQNAPIASDFDQTHYLVMGRVPETGALWTLSDENNISHIYCLGITGGGKTSWALMLAAEILAHENGGVACPYSFHQLLLAE